MPYRRLFVAALAALCLLVFVPSDTSAAPSLASAMRADLGRNPTGWKHKWCAHYLRQVMDRLGYHAAYKRTDARAISFLRLKHIHRTSEPLR